MNTLILLALGLANPPPAGPLHCPTPLADRGEVKAGPPLAHAFELTHRGAAGTLTITKVEAGCGCLRQALSATVLKPGEAATLTIEVNTLTQPDGPNRWQAKVSYTLDVPGSPPQPGELLVNVAARLTREVSVAPAQVGFSCTGEASQTLTVSDARPKPLTVVQAKTTSPHLTAAVGAPVVGADGKRTQPVGLKLAADAPPGHRDETVILLTDDPAYPELRVPVRVLKRVAGAVVAAPEELAVRFAPGQAEVSTLVQVRSPEGKPVGVASAEADHPAVALKWSTGTGPVATVRVTVSAAAAGGSGGCVVRVKLADPAGQEVVVPVSWSRAGK